MIYDVIIVGAGPAGMAAAIYSGRAGFSVLAIERAFAGGQMAISHTIENYPGFKEEIPGALLADNMKVQAQNVGGEIVSEDVKELLLEGEVKKVVTHKNTYEGRTIVLAMGATPKKLGIPGEEEQMGAGVSYCATCDGAFFKDAEVAVVGGGNTAVEDALYLSNICKKVYLIHRRDAFRAQKVLVKKLAEVENIELLLNYIPKSINGKFSVEGIDIENKITGEQKTLEVRGVFVAIGNNPQTDLIKDIIETDENSYIIAGEDCETKIPGVYCAGDLRTKKLRQIVTAAADGAVAVSGIEEYLLKFM